MTVIIKRYQNRKLYNTQSKHYITLGEIEDLIKKQVDIRVIDKETGNDITAITLSQVIHETEKSHMDFLPTQLLVKLVQSRGNKLEDLRNAILSSLSIFRNYDDELKWRVNILVQEGQFSHDEGIKVLDKLLSVSSHHNIMLEIEQMIGDLLANHQVPTKSDLQSLNENIELLSQQIDELRANGDD